MNLNQPIRCQMQLDSQWIQSSVIFMGISVFLKAVYYLGITNMNDIGGFQLATQFILPVIVSAVFLILIKGLNMNSPILLGLLSGLYAVDHLFGMDSGEIVSAILLAINAAVFLATVFGVLQDTSFVIIASAISVLYRIIVVDLFGYIIPFSEWDILGYIPILSNAFAVVSIGLLSPALQMTQRRKQSPTESEPVSE